MKFPLRTVSALICACLVPVVYNCAGQSIPPAPSTHEKPAVAVSEAAAKETAAKETASGTAPAKPAPSTGTSSAKRYIIGPLDELEVKVWNSQNLSGFFPVSPDGMIAMPLIGRIKADGLTEEQLTQVIRDKLAESVFAKTPELNEVTVTVVRINSKKVYVYGGVSRGGEFPLNGDMTVMDVLALCLPFKEFVNPSGIYVLRNGKKLPFNYNDFSKGKKNVQDIPLQNGDRIFVPDAK